MGLKTKTVKPIKLKAGTKIVNGKVVVMSKAQKQAMKKKLANVKNLAHQVKSQVKAIKLKHKKKAIAKAKKLKGAKVVQKTVTLKPKLGKFFGKLTKLQKKNAKNAAIKHKVIVKSKHSTSKLAKKANNAIKKQQNKDAQKIAKLKTKTVKPIKLKAGTKIVNGKVVVMSKAQKLAFKKKLAHIKKLQKQVKSQVKAKLGAKVVKKTVTLKPKLKTFFSINLQKFKRK